MLTWRSFTTRGIVALVFSCVCGILGTIVVAWYGLSTDEGVVPHGVKETIASAGVDTPSNGQDEIVASSSAGGSTGRA